MEQLLSLLKTIPEYAAMVSSLQDGESVAVAASSAGYGDCMNFSRRFKAHFGVSPSKYRALIADCEKDDTFPRE